MLKPGFLDIASRTNASVVPYALHVRPALVLGGKMRQGVALPGSKIIIDWSDPIPAAALSVELCENRLAELVANGRR